MAKQIGDNTTIDAFPEKRTRGRPRKEGSLSNADRQRLYRERHAANPRTHQIDRDAQNELVNLRKQFDKHVDDTRSLVSHLRRSIAQMEKEIDLCQKERSAAFRVVEVYRQRLDMAGLSTNQN